MAQIDIFISSVMESLKKEREQVADAISSRPGLNPVFAEALPAHNDPPIEVCKKRVQNCHIYVGIFDKVWGYVPKKDNEENLSITAMEYNWAKEKELPKFIFVSAIDDKEREHELVEFLKTITDMYKGHWYKQYNDPVHLRELVLTAIDNILIEKFHSKDDSVSKAIPIKDLRMIDAEKRKRDMIARNLLAELQENELKATLISTRSLHEFDTDIWDENKGNIEFLGSGDSALLRQSYVEMKEKNNYLDSIKTARDTRTEQRWLEQYIEKSSLLRLNAMLDSSKKSIVNYLGASGTYPQI